MKNQLGFMQGRLSPVVNGKIQAFPTHHWREEFPAAELLGLSLMEWTLDHEAFEDNPLITKTGRAELRALQRAHRLRIESLTADNMMQAPFWKAEAGKREDLQNELRVTIESCAAIGLRMIVVPLVDNGSIVTPEQDKILFEGLHSLMPLMAASNVQIIFESDYDPARLAEFIARYPEGAFGINFDMGNSAALGWRPEVEIPLLATRIMNVHVKDRPKGGTTVPFGQGDVDFDAVFRLLRAAGYNGNYIMQGARCPNGDDAGILASYISKVEGFLDGR